MAMTTFAPPASRGSDIVRRRRPGFDITFSMIDLFCCSLASGILLFFLVLQHSNREARSQTGGGTPSSTARIHLQIEPSPSRPIMLLKPPGQPFFYTFPSYFTREGGRLIRRDAPGTEGGVYVFYLPTPWDANYDPMVPRTLILEVWGVVKGPWCIGAMLADTVDEFAVRSGANVGPVAVRLAVGSSKPIVTSKPRRLTPGGSFVIEEGLDLKDGRIDPSCRCSISADQPAQSGPSRSC